VRKRYPILCLILCLILGGCSWWPWGNNDQEATAPAVKTIGVVSVLSDRIAVIDAGNKGWSRQTAFYPLAGWQIDDLASKQATAWLREKGFDARPVSASAGAFSAQALGGPVSDGGWFDRQRPSFTEIIHRSVQPADLDYYLILVEASGSSSIRDLHGIGLVHFSGRPQAFVAYHLFLVDGKSGETIDDVHADAKNDWGDNAALDSPNIDLPKAVWPRQIAAWSPEQQAAFRDAVETELKSSLKATLRRLDLP
jgi:hypothetical protein